ncbi:hypothetical protein ACWERY_02030 [Streptomyces sp. NPDC004082]
MEPASDKSKEALAERRGADIEIIDRNTGGPVLVPSTGRINGVEIPIPSGTKIRVHDIREDEAVTVTLTLFARRVVIAAEDDLT